MNSSSLRYRFHQNKSRVLATILPVLFYTFIISIIWSPYFTPPLFGRTDTFVIGDGGIMRLDQFLLPILILFIIYEMHINDWYKFKFLNSTLFWFFCATAIILAFSTILGVHWRGYPFRIGDFYESIVWMVYAATIAFFPIYLKSKQIQKGLILILISSALASILAIVESPFSSLSFTYTVTETLYPTQQRAVAPARNPNVLAQLLTPALLITIALLYRIGLKNRQAVSTLGFALLSLLIFLGIFSTQSRGTILPVAVGILAMVFFISFIDKEIPTYRTLGFLTAPIGISILIIWMAWGLGRFEELMRITESNLFTDRIPAWKALIPIISDGFIFGYGTSNVGLVEYSEQHGNIDSGVLEVWYQRGIIGVLLMCGIILYSFRLAISLITDRELCKNQPVIWCGSAALFGLSIAMILMWPLRRLEINNASQFFSLFLILLVFNIAESVSNRELNNLSNK